MASQLMNFHFVSSSKLTQDDLSIFVLINKDDILNSQMWPSG